MLIVICFFSRFAYGFFLAVLKSYSSLMLITSFPLRLIGLFFSLGCFPRRYNPDNGFGLPVTMTNNQKICPPAEPQQNKSFLLFRMIRVEKQQHVLIIKDRLGFFERDMMFFLVRYVLVGIPFKKQLVHNYNIIMIPLFVKGIYWYEPPMSTPNFNIKFPRRKPLC